MNPGNSLMIQPKMSIPRLYSRRRKCNFQKRRIKSLQDLRETTDLHMEVRQQQTRNQKVNLLRISSTHANSKSLELKPNTIWPIQSKITH